MKTKKRKSGEHQYLEFINSVNKKGYERMGLMTSWAWYDDPKRLAFMISRYKFVSKMFFDFKKVAEVGCGDGFGSRVVSGSVGHLDCYDFDIELLESAKITQKKSKNKINFYFHDILKNKLKKKYDGIYSLDVFEHIEKTKEKRFLKNIINSLNKNGVLILGAPSLESQKYASKFSKLGHVNCKTQKDFKKLLENYFKNVFAFSMNDEVLHTGFSKMSHYNLLICCK
tara:strand:+ start:313 stop:993 length:681 start_codon:yes stop_codon:yes gene_type:complete